MTVLVVSLSINVVLRYNILLMSVFERSVSDVIIAFIKILGE